jgi:RNA polymerase sigma-70 factor (ECF subfamily)
MDDPMTRTWDLVHKAQRGDGEALDRLFARYYERLRRAVRARIGQKLRARLETEDILQPTFARAFQNFDRFEMRHEGSLMNWLAEYAKRQLLDAADRENAKKRNPPAPPVPIEAHSGDGAMNLPDSATAPLERVTRDERVAAIEQCLDDLPEHYRMVLVLRDYDGLEWVEVAARLGKNTDSAARELHRRALLELTRRLHRRGIGPERG